MPGRRGTICVRLLYRCAGRDLHPAVARESGTPHGPVTPRARTSAALRHRDFALLWSGQSISLVGDGVYTVALALETLRIDNHPLALSLVLAARLLPTVLLLVAGGVIVDRVPRRLAMLTSDTTRGVAVGVVALLVALGALQVWELVIISAVFGAADALFYPAATAVTPEILPADLLVQGSALNHTSETMAQMLIGPALGGLVVATLGYQWAFAIEALSFAVSAACVLAMASRPRPAPSGHSALADAREGLRYVRSQRWLWVSLGAAGLANFAAFSPLALLVPLLIRNVLDQGPLALGLVLAAGGVGGGVTALLVARLGAPRLRITSMWAGWAVSAGGIVVLSLAPNVWVAGALALIITGTLMYGNVLWNPIMQELVPPELLGRASSVDWLVSLSLSPLGVLVRGAVAGVVGTRTTMLVGGCVALAVCGILFVPGVRDPERRLSSRNAPASR
jgi:predicted MFS family arabinose efflux permease